MAKQITGLVSSDKASKSIVVSVDIDKTHPIYRKKFTNTRKIMAHDDKDEAKTGDKVLIEETKPISAKKRFKLVKVLERPVLRDSDKKGEVA